MMICGDKMVPKAFMKKICKIQFEELTSNLIVMNIKQAEKSFLLDM